jgi:hypothetical protein
VQLEKGQSIKRCGLESSPLRFRDITSLGRFRPSGKRAKRAAIVCNVEGGTRETLLMKFIKIIALAMFAACAGVLPAKAMCLFNCEPKPADARKVFENLVKTKFDKDAVVEKFDVTRFWPLDVEGAGHAGYEFYFTASVRFPKGANPECKPDGAGKVKEGCSASTYYSTTVQNQMVKEKQYIEPGKVVDFKDETRFDESSGKWKGQDGNLY